MRRIHVPAGDLAAIRRAAFRAAAIRAAVVAINDGRDATRLLAAAGVPAGDVPTVVAILRGLRLGRRDMSAAPADNRPTATWRLAGVVAHAADMTDDPAARASLAGLRGRILSMLGGYEINVSEIVGDASDGNTNPD